MVTIDNYEVYHRLGKGGYGSVYLARDKNLNELVALKVLDKSDDDAVERFLREIKTMITLSHSEHVVRIFDYGIYNDRPFYSMEYHQRGSLKNFIGLANLRFAYTVLLNVASALVELESRGGFHRDIKPDNILVSENQYRETIVKLSDFGLARTADTTFFTNRPAGTTPYMSPNALVGKPFDIKDDIFSLGVTMTELLRGLPERDPTALMQDSTKLDLNLRRLESIIQKMIEPKPEARMDLQNLIRIAERHSKNLKG
jgi:eukaryotic-like serine/threonine-protein kinase